ncbi:MAG: sensor histidine kinase [Aureispira sp.]
MDQRILTIFVLLGVGTILLIMLLFSLFIFVRLHLQRMREEEQKKMALMVQHQQELSIALVEEQERERARIASELHDDLIAQLHRIKLSNQDQYINKMLKQSIQRARQLSHDLTPPMLAELSLESLLMDFLEPFQEHYTIQLHLNHSENRALEQAQKLQLFRIFQEVITNINKHAKATAIDITYRFQQRYCCLMVKDNGVGFDPHKRNGLGLKNIQLRSQLLQGQYKIKTNQPQGTTFIFFSYERPTKN